MNLFNNKKGQAIDTEVLSSPGFAILSALAVVATFIGWYASRNMEYHFPLWQVGIIMVVEVIICYIFAMKMFD